jgi:hypothetical protein
MKVTLFHASLENREPFMETAMAPNKASPDSAAVTTSPFWVVTAAAAQACCQLACQISCLAPKAKPKMISPNKDNSLASVNTVCITLPW